MLVWGSGASHETTLSCCNASILRHRLFPLPPVLVNGAFISLDFASPLYASRIRIFSLVGIIFTYPLVVVPRFRKVLTGARRSLMTACTDKLLSNVLGRFHRFFAVPHSTSPIAPRFRICRWRLCRYPTLFFHACPQVCIYAQFLSLLLLSHPALASKGDASAEAVQNRDEDNGDKGETEDSDDDNSLSIAGGVVVFVGRTREAASEE